MKITITTPRHADPALGDRVTLDAEIYTAGKVVINGLGDGIIVPAEQGDFLICHRNPNGLTIELDGKTMWEAGDIDNADPFTPSPRVYAPNARQKT